VEFLGIGYQELLLVLILMLVVVGPERLPGMAYQIGRAVRTLQQYARQVRDEFSDEIGYLEEQVRVVKGEVGSLNSELRDQTAKFNAELRQATEPIQSELRQATELPRADAISPVPSEAALVLSNGVAPNGASLNGHGPAPDTEAAGPTAETAAAEAKTSGQPPLVF
jgi:sec-independent protein translocase protein TatB